MTDIAYTQDGMFTRFIPLTSHGEAVWREMAEKCMGVAAVLNFEAKAVISQMRAAGYKVAKAKKSAAVWTEEDNALLRELGI